MGEATLPQLKPPLPMSNNDFKWKQGAAGQKHETTALPQNYWGFMHTNHLLKMDQYSLTYHALLKPIAWSILQTRPLPPFTLCTIWNSWTLNKLSWDRLILQPMCQNPPEIGSVEETTWPSVRINAYIHNTYTEQRKNCMQ